MIANRVKNLLPSNDLLKSKERDVFYIRAVDSGTGFIVDIYFLNSAWQVYRDFK